MKIRICKESDSKEVYQLICELEDTIFEYKEFETIFVNKINKDVNYFIVCEKEDKIIAFLSLYIDYQLHHTKKVATIEELIVSKEYRGNGAGKVLLEKAINYAKENQCEVIELTSNLSRKQAHHFYIKNGFEKSSYKFKFIL